MIRHMLLIKWKKGVSPARIDEVVEATLALRALDCIADLRCGSALGLVADSCDFALIIDFASEKDWHEYLGHPAHEAAAALVRPLVETFARIQIAVD